MLKIHNINDPQIANIPPPYSATVIHALQNLCSTDSPDPPDKDWGFVVFIEPDDRPELVSGVIRRDVSIALDGVFRDEGCLVGVSLYGNSGDSATIVCPDKEGYANDVANILKQYLPEEL